MLVGRFVKFTCCFLRGHWLRLQTAMPVSEVFDTLITPEPSNVENLSTQLQDVRRWDERTYELRQQGERLRTWNYIALRKLCYRSQTHTVTSSTSFTKAKILFSTLIIGFRDSDYWSNKLSVEISMERSYGSETYSDDFYERLVFPCAKTLIIDISESYIFFSTIFEVVQFCLRYYSTDQ